jgi:hypothetical protein
MSASFVHHQKAPARCISVLSPFLRHVNTGTLALIMFVALAFLSTTRGKEAETRELIPTGTTKSDCHEDAFNDPFLIKYTNQQGVGIAGSPTAPILDTSSLPPVFSNSPSSPLSRSSSHH